MQDEELIPQAPKEINIAPLESSYSVDPEKSLLPIDLVGDRVIIEQIESSKFLSEKANITKSLEHKDNFSKGKVVSLGGEEFGASIPKKAKIGCFVYYYHQNAMTMNFEKDKTHHLIRGSDIIGIV